MVILTKKVGQVVRIVQDADLGPAAPIGELFVDGNTKPGWRPLISGSSHHRPTPNVYVST